MPPTPLGAMGVNELPLTVTGKGAAGSLDAWAETGMTCAVDGAVEFPWTVAEA
jgi:hypothetical protein